MIKPSALNGIIIVLIGSAGLVHPRIIMPAKKDVAQTGDAQVITETRRIMTVPRRVSGMLILVGGGLILLGTRKPRR